MEVLSFVKEGDVESVKAWWLINVDGSTLTRDQLLVFLEACGFGHESMVFCLWGLIPSVSKTVLLEKDNYFGILKAASRSGNVNLFQFLWEKGIDIKSNREVIIECITLACQKGHVSMLRNLFDKIKHFYKDMRQATRTAYISAAQSGQLPVMEFIDRKYGVIIRFEALEAVCSSTDGSLAAIEYLTAEMDLKNKLDITEYALFQSALSARNIDIAKFLYENATDHAKVHFRTQDNHACLRNAIARENTEAISYLWSVMSSHEKVHLKELSKEVFCAAAQTGDIAVVREWYDRAGAKLKVSLVEEQDWKPFRLAAQRGHLSVVQYLWGIASTTQRKAMMKAAEYDAFTSSCANGHLDVVKYLASVNTIAADSFTTCQYGAVAFALAAGSNEKDIINFLWQKYPTPKRKLEVLQYRNMYPFALALRSNHKEMLTFLFAAGEKTRIKVEVSDLTQLLCDAVISGELHTVSYWYHEILLEDQHRQSALVYNGFSAFNKAALNNHVDIARFLIANITEPTTRQTMLLYQDCFVFQRAVTSGNLPMVQLMYESIAPAHKSSLLTNGVILLAAEHGQLAVLCYFHHLVNIEGRDWNNMVVDDHYRAFVRAMSNRHVNVARFLMRTCASCFAYAEKHSREFDDTVTNGFVHELFTELQNRQENYQFLHPNGVFDIEDTNETMLCLYLIRYEIRRRCNVDKILFLLHLPGVRAKVHLPLDGRVQAARSTSDTFWNDFVEPNVLLDFAREQYRAATARPLYARNSRIGQQGFAREQNGAAIDTVIAILLSIPAVAALDRNHQHGNFRRPTQPELYELATDRESSMVGLTQEEEFRLQKLLSCYAPPGTAPRTLEPLRAELKRRYASQPATVHVLGRAITLPLSRDAFDALKLPPSALQAYYSHSVHTALRYISNPNMWMHERADYLNLGERCSTFEEYSTLIAVLFAAASDRNAAATDGYTVETRIEQFIKELALIGRAHNWDKTRTCSGRPGEREEFDDLEGDRPSCYSGVKRRLFQSVHGHPLMKFLTPSMLTEELRGFARDYFKRNITPAMKSSWKDYVILLDYDALVALDALNIPDEDVAAFVLQLTEKYGAHSAQMIKSHAQNYFQLSTVHRNHVVKLAGTTDLDKLFDSIPDAV